MQKAVGHEEWQSLQQKNNRQFYDRTCVTRRVSPKVSGLDKGRVVKHDGQYDGSKKSVKDGAAKVVYGQRIGRLGCGQAGEKIARQDQIDGIDHQIKVACAAA